MKARLLNHLPLLAALLLYAITCSFDFSGDDFDQIVNNPYVTTHSFDSILKTPTFPGDLYRPLPLLSFSLEHLIAGNSPALYHSVNVALYCIVIVLIQSLFGITTALVFAVLPIHIESVSQIYAGRTELLGAILALFAIQACRKNRILLGSLCAGLGIFSKESLVVTPFLVALDQYYQQKTKGEGLQAFASTLGGVMLAITLRMLVVTPALLPTDPIDNQLITLSLYDRLLPCASLLGRYLLNCFAPLAVGLDTSIGNTPIELTAVDYLYILTLLSAIYFIVSRLLTGARHSQSVYGLLWFFVAFGATSNIFLIGTAYGDRLAFLPSIGIAVLLSAVEGTKRLRLILGGYILICSIITIVLVQSFKSDRTLLVRRSTISPNARVLANLAALQRNDGDFKSAIQSANAAISMYPDYDFAYFVLGSTYMFARDFESGLRAYHTALTIAPNSELTLNGLGRYYLSIGNDFKAAIYFKKLLAINPQSFDGRLGMAVLLLKSAPQTALQRLTLLKKERPDDHDLVRIFSELNG